MALGILGLLVAMVLGLVWFHLSRPGAPELIPLVGVVTLGLLSVTLFLRLRMDLALAQAEQEEGAAYIERVADLCEEGHAILDAQTQAYLFANSALERLLGYSPETLMSGGPGFLADLIHSEDQALSQAQWNRLMDPSRRPRGRDESEPVVEETLRVRAKWGEYRWIHLRRVVLFRNPDGTPKEVLSVAHDASERRAWETALVRVRELESLALLNRGVAHDLQNALMGVQGYADLAQRHGEEGAYEEALVRISEQAARALSLCGQLMTYGGRGRLRLQRGDLNAVLREGLPFLETLLPQKIDLEFDLGVDLPEVRVDPGLLRSALLNLVVNALDNLGRDPGHIHLSTRRLVVGEEEGALRPGDYLCLEVRDDGPGMTPERLEAVFDPFQSEKYMGRGLGMLTLQGIAEEHRGFLQAESRLGEGSTFRLLLPLAERLPEDLEEGELIPGRGMVLLVEDELGVRATLSLCLRDAGYQVLEAADGLEGLAAFRRNRKNLGLVLLDLTMPRMGGEEVLRAIRDVDPSLPVVLMSGYAAEEAAEALRDSGPTAFLQKPCTLRQVQQLVEGVLGRPGERD